MQIYDNAFGVNHMNAIDSIMRLGCVYENQREYDKAIAQYQQALKIYENACSLDHINTADNKPKKQSKLPHGDHSCKDERLRNETNPFNSKLYGHSSFNALCTSHQVQLVLALYPACYQSDCQVCSLQYPLIPPTIAF